MDVHTEDTELPRDDERKYIQSAFQKAGNNFSTPKKLVPKTNILGIFLTVTQYVLMNVELAFWKQTNLIFSVCLFCNVNTSTKAHFKIAV